jgi:hypothetical protein
MPTAGRVKEVVVSRSDRVSEQTAGWVREQIAYVFGMYAYAYGFPLVLMDLTRRVLTAAPRSGEYSAPVSQFHRIRDFVSPDFKNVVRISRSLLWSTAFLDLDAGPAVFSQCQLDGVCSGGWAAWRPGERVLTTTQICGWPTGPGIPGAVPGVAPRAR